MIILFRFKDQNITVVKEQVKLLNESFDVSGSPDGVCIVTRSILLSNSHAGTHADQPVSNYFCRITDFLLIENRNTLIGTHHSQSLMIYSTMVPA
jgi:hypothetical protein